MTRVRAEIVYEPEVAEKPLLEGVSIYQMYLLHSKADRVLRSAVSGQLDGFELSLAEWLLLSVVSEGPDQGLSLSEIARRLDVSQPQVTALMAAISGRKLVKQRTQRHDRRSRHVSLSVRGQRLLEQAEYAVMEKMPELMRGISRKQLAAYLETIRHIQT